jgi:DNA-binding CsgD family transcriptional regulator
MLSREVLSAAGIKGGQAPKHRWTEEEEEIVRRDYRGTRLSCRMIAANLGVTEYAVKGKAAALGILQQKSPPWTAEELERLQLLIHKHAIPQIAKKLGRSCNAVKIKATRLKLGLRTRDDWYTKKDVCEILGVDHHKVQAWIDSGALVATWHSEKKPQRNGMAMWHITTEALRSFIIRRSGELMGRNVDIQQIVWIIAGDMKVYHELKGEKE